MAARTTAATSVPDPRAMLRVKELLLDWYAVHKRDLPWRRTRDPYAILVAEVMLQQTQVDRVIPIWSAWLEKFPTTRALARASRGAVIRAWQGLGYNLRAVRLHDIARQVEAQYDGALPRSVEGLLALKGVGRYTAGAVACFAYAQPVAMVDTNIRRVLSRVLGVEATEVEVLAAALVPPDTAYVWNQSLMDLGATLCRPRRPLCLVCPLVSECSGPRLAPRLSRSAGEFRGSRRYYRGRLVEVVRRLPDGASMSLNELVAQLADSSSQTNRDQLVALVRQLAAEGLLSVALNAEQQVRLPD